MLQTVQWFLSTCCHSVVMVHGHAVLSCCEKYNTVNLTVQWFISTCCHSIVIVHGWDAVNSTTVYQHIIVSIRILGNWILDYVFLKEYTWNNYTPQKSMPQTTILPKYGTFPHWKLWCVCLKMCGNPLMHKNVNVLQFLNATNEQIKKKRGKKKRKKKKRKMTCIQRWLSFSLEQTISSFSTV